MLDKLDSLLFKLSYLFWGVSLRAGLYVAIFLLVPYKKDFYFNP